MTQDLWTSVDDYLFTTLKLHDDKLAAALAASDAAGLPAIQVSPSQGRFLEILTRMSGGTNILEIGTLAGYSTLFLARGLRPHGRIVTLELEPKHADVATANFVAAGLSDRIELHLGSALETLPQLIEGGYGPFDLVFIDADKANIPAYFELARRMARVGTLIVVDNVVREGAVIDSQTDDASVVGVRRMNEMLAEDSRVTATVLQTVGSKGYDGLALALVVQL